MLPQQSFDGQSSFQYSEKHHPDQEYSFHQQLDTAPVKTSPEAIASHNFDAEVLAGFRRGYREHAVSTAERTLAAGVSATETILQMATWIQEMKSRLSRKEFGTFVKELLQWVGGEARKYLDIARAFEGFDLKRLVNLEPFTILKLRSKRYAPVVAKLREQPVITPQVVEDLIRELLPKQSRKKRPDAISGWKQSQSGGTRYYNVILHDEETGLSVEQQAEAEGILPQRVIAEAVAARYKHKSSPVQINEYVAAQLEELSTVVEHARSLDRENRKLMHQLQQQERRIAELEAQLAFRVAPSEVKSNNFQEHAARRFFELEIEDEVAIASRELNEYLEDQVVASAPEPTTRDELKNIEATDYLKPEQESLHPDPVGEDDRAKEKEENTLRLKVEPQAIHVGDRVEIVSSRQGVELVGQIGAVKVANTFGCVVEVLGKTKWFCTDELVLVSIAPPAPAKATPGTRCQMELQH